MTKKAEPKPKNKIKGSRLSFIKRTERVNKKGYQVYGLYRCDCGAFKETIISQVNGGKVKSCGCLHSETSQNTISKVKPGGAKTHGLRYHPLYHVWLNMRQRCNNPKVPCYKYYGGRGITICERWDSFKNFFDDVSDGYKKGYELDRIDNDGPYAPNNVQWIPHKRNSQKRPYCKLSKGKANMIRNSDLPNKQLALCFNVSEGTIAHVRQNKTWI